MLLYFLNPLLPFAFCSPRGVPVSWWVLSGPPCLVLFLLGVEGGGGGGAGPRSRPRDAPWLLSRPPEQRCLPTSASCASSPSSRESLLVTLFSRELQSTARTAAQGRGWHCLGQSCLRAPLQGPRSPFQSRVWLLSGPSPPSLSLLTGLGPCPQGWLGGRQLAALSRTHLCAAALSSLPEPPPPRQPRAPSPVPPGPLCLTRCTCVRAAPPAPRSVDSQGH